MSFSHSMKYVRSSACYRQFFRLRWIVRPPTMQELGWWYQEAKMYSHHESFHTLDLAMEGSRSDDRITLSQDPMKPWKQKPAVSSSINGTIHPSNLSESKQNIYIHTKSSWVLSHPKKKSAKGTRDGSLRRLWMTWNWTRVKMSRSFTASNQTKYPSAGR